MGVCSSANHIPKEDVADYHNTNVHIANPDLIVHTVISAEFDFDHPSALLIALGEVSDEQLVAEIASRKLDPYTVPSTTPDSTEHLAAMKNTLKDSSNGALFTEVARRKIKILNKINESVVHETYEMGKILGHGASGKVYICRHKQSNKQFACKVIQKDADMNDAQSMSTEIEIMKRIRHKNVVAMYELYETPKCLWLILELVDAGDLREFITNNRCE